MVYFFEFMLKVYKKQRLPWNFLIYEVNLKLVNIQTKSQITVHFTAQVTSDEDFELM